MLNSLSAPGDFAYLLNHSDKIEDEVEDEVDGPAFASAIVSIEGQGIFTAVWPRRECYEV
jgi:hypothetical protein